MKIIDGSVIRFENATFSSNKAANGGGLMVHEQSMLHCIDCLIQDNIVEGTGGGVCIGAKLYPDQPVAFQCDDCSFDNNSASMGGGFHVGSQGDPEDDAYVVLRGTTFQNNNAQIGGGAIMAVQPPRVLIWCTHTPSYDNGQSGRQVSSLASGYIELNDTSLLRSLDRTRQCTSWSNNQVPESGYGNVVASRVSYALAEYEPWNDQPSVDRAVLVRSDTIPKLSPINVTLFDEFNQSLAEGREDHPNVTVSLRAGEESMIELSGQLTLPLTRGRAVLNEVIVRGEAGNHTLMLEFSDCRISNVSIEMEILHCPVGWEAVSNNMSCERCQEETYNFDPVGGTCRDCLGHRAPQEILAAVPLL